MISPSTIAAAARVIEHAAARPIVLSAGLMPPGKGVAEGAEAGNTQDGRANSPVPSQPLVRTSQIFGLANVASGSDPPAGLCGPVAHVRAPAASLSPWP